MADSKCKTAEAFELSELIGPYLRTSLFENDVLVRVSQGWGKEYENLVFKTPEAIADLIDIYVYEFTLYLKSNPDIYLVVEINGSGFYKYWKLGTMLGAMRISTEFVFENCLDESEQEDFVFNLHLLKT